MTGAALAQSCALQELSGVAPALAQEIHSMEERALQAIDILVRPWSASQLELEPQPFAREKQQQHGQKHKHQQQHQQEQQQQRQQQHPPQSQQQGPLISREPCFPAMYQVPSSPMPLWELSSLLALLPSLHLALPEAAASQTLRAKVQSSWYAPQAPQAGRGRALFAQAVEVCLGGRADAGAVRSLLSPEDTTASSGAQPEHQEGQQEGSALGIPGPLGCAVSGASLRELQLLSLVCRRLAGATPASHTRPHQTGQRAHATGDPSVASTGAQILRAAEEEVRRRVQWAATHIPSQAWRADGAPTGALAPGRSPCAGDGMAEGDLGKSVVTRESDTVTPHTECSICGAPVTVRDSEWVVCQGLKGLGSVATAPAGWGVLGRAGCHSVRRCCFSGEPVNSAEPAWHCRLCSRAANKGPKVEALSRAVQAMAFVSPFWDTEARDPEEGPDMRQFMAYMGGPAADGAPPCCAFCGVHMEDDLSEARLADGA